jgi:hypothetical protein
MKLETLHKKTRRTENLPLIQKRSYHSSPKLKISSIFGELTNYLIRLPRLTDPRHLQDVNIIRDCLRSAFTKGDWSKMRRSYPLPQAMTLLDQA